MIKVIVFDLWRTLIPATIDFVHLISLLKKEGIEKEDFIERYEKATQLKKYKNFEELRKDFFSAFKEESNSDLEQELYEIYSNRFDKIHFFSDVISVLEKLKKQKYKIALLSNTESLMAKEIEKKLKFKNYFDYLAYSFEIGFIKPDKRAFSVIVKKFKVKPKEVLMVGDSLRCDVAGAITVGFNSCLINRTGTVLDYADVKPDFEIKSLKEIFEILGVLNAKS